MELKRYQQAVINDLTRFLALVGETGNIGAAYQRHWEDKHVTVGFGGLPYYQNTVSGVPDVCLKVPTGGGKTFIAASAVKPIFESLPFTKCKAVVWLVPSEAILAQTYNALSDSGHPYRQKINTDFSNRVEVYNKQQLLNGQNFNPTVVNEQLSIFVLSYDSFRTSIKEGRKAYQENGNLAMFAKFFNDPDILLADTDETALIQVIRYLNPVVIVDESHHATSDLSIRMLTDFNPCFILDLTATPKPTSNVISFVDALQLKRENMVKLPVIVYNRHSYEEVYSDAIHLRDRLEAQAKAERERSGKYIRPIVLFQAQPRNNADNATFEKIKRYLTDIGIPSEQIAIKTADINELRNVELMREDCPIRYIITVNALKEGWDCPFAYILATIANRTSTVDVEQILGRVLRLPYTHKNESNVLNVSYVITSSNDFHETLERVIKGLNNAGFSSKDCRARDVAPTPTQTAAPVQIQLPEDEGIPAIDIAAIRERLEEQQSQADAEDSIESDPMLAAAIQQTDDYDTALSQVNPSELDLAPMEVRSMMNVFRMNEAFAEEASALHLPQFFVPAPPSLFSDSETVLLTKENLFDGFTLRDKDTVIDFTSVSADIRRVDLDESPEALPKAWHLSSTDKRFFMEHFQSRPTEQRINICKDLILGRLSRINSVSDRELKDYVGRVVDGLSPELLDDLQQSPFIYGDKIKKKVESLLAVHAEERFNLMVEQGRIVCQPSYAFPETISPIRSISTFPRTLYSEEEDMNGLELDVADAIANMPNVKWWHRNIANSGYCINGFITAYPDIIVMTNSGKLVMVEPKGDHLGNTDSRQKVAIGRVWQNLAGSSYRYYMVFRDRDLNVSGAYRLDRFLEIMREL